MNHEGLKRRTPVTNENDDRLKQRRQGVKVREDFDDDWDDNHQEARHYDVSDDENLN